ncbi:hypothetical protein C4553_01315 [Candidatus Parcubacteria bacterium]|nr:MAG: hypothetical protein C4553_01315 [Candidatus Parcubacteria bacterium]
MKDITYRLSPSSLNLLRDCPRCFWLKYRLKIDRPSSPLASIATGLDLNIKNYFGKYRVKGLLPPILEKKVSGRNLKLVPRPISFLKFIDEEGVVFVGKLDEALILDDKFYAPLDHKTRASPTQNVHQAYQLQMDAYDLLLEKNGYKTKNVAFLAYFTPRSGELHLGFPFDLDLKEIKTSPQRAQDFINKAKDTLLSEDIPVASPTCQFCGYINRLSETL